MTLLTKRATRLTKGFPEQVPSLSYSRGHQKTPVALSWPLTGRVGHRRLHGRRPRRPRSAPYPQRDLTGLDDPEGDGDGGRGCEEMINEPRGGGAQGGTPAGGAGGVRRLEGPGDWLARGRVGRVHVVETVVTITVKDINDNPPLFPNTTMFGEVQENGPIDLSVGVVSAWDADDASEGTNAQLTYAIQKNVVHDRTGEAIFAVDPQSGLIRTALCCLDRETTPEYHIQVVATDGGGLKGTGTVVVRLTDVNDNSPRLSRHLWELEVDETWGDGPPDGSTLLEMSAVDRDTSNYFFYRVVEASGWGWQHFNMRSVGATGQLYATRTLDFENETHRRGFKFMVQVTDRGRGGWTDPRHLASAWVSVRLRDVNDNPPQFRRPHAHVTIREDAAPGTLLAALPAHDPDRGGALGEVDYRVTGGWGALTVDAGGGVSLLRSLDREAPDGGAVGVARVIGVDRGAPPLTATATLTITVTDVNDCAPRLLPPTVLHVAEGGAPALLGVLTATDSDVWALGHGPPFTFSLAPTNPAHVLAHISLSLDPQLDSGRGGAELWAVGGLDREEERQLRVEVVVADAQGLATTQALTVVVDDCNDHPMKPAAKTVHLWTTQGGVWEAPLGRVYVEDPDDWDLGDKTFRWRGAPHPLFSLRPEDGALHASTHLHQGRYELQFLVSDRAWDQRDVSANVTVLVKVLSHDALAHATPITLTPTTPLDLTRGWTPKGGGGGLGTLLEAVGRVLGGGDLYTVEVVSVSGHQHLQHSNTPSSDATTQSPTSPATPWDLREAPTRRAPSTSVWVSVTQKETGRFMDPVKLQGLLNLHLRQLEETTHLTVVTEENSPRAGGEGRDPGAPRPYYPGLRGAPPSAATSASRALPLQVVDANATSLVTPRLSRTHACHAREPEGCTPSTCLNGGRCARSSQGNRCVCPQGSTGPRCKVLGRTFLGKGWAWVQPLPPCLPATISFSILTRRPHALLLYSGPMARPRQPRAASATPLLAVQLDQGRPQVLVEGVGGSLKAEVNATLHDGGWHTLHLQLDAQGVSLMLDFCGRGWDTHPPDDSHCLARAAWTTPSGVEAWVGAASPLQLGGLAHAPPRPEDHGWREAPTSASLDGCLANLALSGQLVDLGQPAHSWGSAPGCRPQEAACPGGCGRRGRCVGGLEHPECECDPGWAGSRACDTPTVPAALGRSSYAKVALSFAPAPRVVSVQLRVRTRGPRHGLLLHLAGHHRASALTIHLRGGVACASVSGSRRRSATSRGVCVEGRPLGDGEWHTVRAERHGHNLVVSVDDGDAPRRNVSLASLMVPSGGDDDDADDTSKPPAPLDVDKHDAVTVGGVPEFAGVSLLSVHDDLRDSCVDDLRVSGRPLPLPPAVNGTDWGQVTTSEGVTRGCQAADACVNITCAPPLSCTSTWGQASCSCGPGRQLVSRACEDLNECLWSPCLHGGSCHNLRPGYLCVCGPGHTGDHCQWATLTPEGHPLRTPAGAAVMAISLLLLVIVGVAFFVRLHRQWLRRTLAGRQVGGDHKAIATVKGGAVDEGGGGGGGRGRKQQLRREPDPITFLQCLKYNLRHARPPSCGQDEDALQQDPGLASYLEAPPLPDLPAGGPLLPRDDLRAYAYEGEGSSAGSLTSAISGLRAEVDEEGSGIRPLMTEFLEVMDLLKHLPEAARTSPTLLGNKGDEEVARSCNTSRGLGQPPSPATPPHVVVALDLPTPGVKRGVASPLGTQTPRHPLTRPASPPASKVELPTTTC
ncbi:neural-cadherin-like [Panulirus ornatus]|uniref:neural-cadherin-like n=1 Tax=Panulirus ornatus TaxID=150431 RepID=UPI003A88771C